MFLSSIVFLSHFHNPRHCLASSYNPEIHFRKVLRVKRKQHQITKPLFKPNKNSRTRKRLRSSAKFVEVAGIQVNYEFSAVASCFARQQIQVLVCVVNNKPLEVTAAFQRIAAQVNDSVWLHLAEDASPDINWECLDIISNEGHVGVIDQPVYGIVRDLTDTVRSKREFLESRV